jgi:calcineurin-like phosphoesterase family protein
VKTARYFDEQVIRKRPYIDLAMCEAVIAAPLRTVVQPDGRVWAEVRHARDGKTRILRVVTLEDGATVHNAFFDRDFIRDRP